MKACYRTVVLVCCCLIVHCTKAQTFPDFKPLRYDENYLSFSSDSLNDNWYRKLKYSNLSKNKNSYISFGGDVRFQYFCVKNENWGNTRDKIDSYILSRYLLHTDIHADKHVRSFIELQSSLANDKNEPSTVDEDELEVHQAFVDYSTNMNANEKLIFRAGRQEFSYGSQRLISFRDGPNNRRSFDAVKAMFTSKQISVDAFYSHPVSSKGLFNDEFNNKKNRFWGSYIVLNAVPILKNVDVYYLGLSKSSSVYENATGKELRHSIGTRIWGNIYSLKYDGETVYQFGNIDSKTISAYTVSLSASDVLKDLKFKPALGLKTEVISGDKNCNDDKLQTFNPLFPRGGYFGLAAFIGPSNLFDVHPSLSFEIRKNINWDIDVDFFHRYSCNDGIYSPASNLIFSSTSTSSKVIGHQYATYLIYQPKPFLYIRGEFTFFKAGEFLKEVSPGKNILFTGVTLQLEF